MNAQLGTPNDDLIFLMIIAYEISVLKSIALVVNEIIFPIFVRTQSQIQPLVENGPMYLFIKSAVAYVLLLSTFFCVSVHGQYSAQILKVDSLQNQLVVTNATNPGLPAYTKRMNYPIFKLREADLDNSGHNVIILGVVKRTKFDTTRCKRINIWKIEDNAIIPMWLGSKLSHPLYDFELKKDKSISTICTIESENDGLYLVAAYQWHSFGLKFIRYIKREITLDIAYQTLNNEL